MMDQHPNQMNQQRLRRFKTFYERKEHKKIEEKNNIDKEEKDVGYKCNYTRI